MKLSPINKYLLIIICLAASACSGIKYLPEGEKLYTGADTKFVSADKIDRKSKKILKATTKGAVSPQPNKSYLGLRPRLWLYGRTGEDPKTKIGKWLREKGEPPVLMSSVKPGVTSAIIDAKIFNIGIFKSYTNYKTEEKKHTARLTYTSYIHEPFTIKELSYAISDTGISRVILAAKEKSFIKPGADYNLTILKGERIRIDALLKDQGYFYFSPDYLIFKADTSAKERTVNLSLTLKDTIPDNSLTVYRINKVIIDQDFSLAAASEEYKRDTTIFQAIHLLGKESDMNIRPRVIANSVFLRKNEIYSRRNHKITLNRLMSIGNFKFIQVKFTESDTTAPGLLDVSILMTPMQKHTFRAEVELVSKSNNYTGPRMNLSILNRNAFKGAEFLNLNMAGSFEAQLSGKSKNAFSYSWNPQVELIFPFFMSPFKIKSRDIMYVPKTRFLVSYNYLKRVDYFDMRTLQFLYGYKWKKDIRSDFELNPVNISFTAMGNESEKFKELLASNPYLSKSYEEQFIAGGSFSYTHNEQLIAMKKIQYFFHWTSEVGGNAFSLANRIGGKANSRDNPAMLFGSVYSQYARLSTDVRGYYNFANKNKLAARVFIGLAKAYGNSSVLPYTKQFFSGGPNSIRAFQINTLGPGSYHQDTDQIGFLQLGGDIKLEMNAEYRFTIYRFLKAAIFADAGNIWLVKSNTDAGSSFSFGGFGDDIAVGAGLGLRLDVSFFVLRFDLATPLRKPWLEKGHKWVASQMNFGDKIWRNENLILNVAIGYPF